MKSKKVKISIKQKKLEIKEGDTVMVPYTVGKFTKAIVKEIKDQYVKVKYVEKKILEAMNSDTAVYQLQNIRKLDTDYEINSERDEIIPESWVHFNKKEFPEWINTVFFPYRIKEEEKPSTVWEWRPYQKFVRDYLGMTSPYRGLLLYHGLGSGKCHRKDTPIMLSDGNIKKVQDIKVGEKLMGDDTRPREILSLATGKDKIYMIKSKNHKYGVNSEHILCLKNKDTKIKQNEDGYNFKYFDFQQRKMKKYISNNLEEIESYKRRIDEDVLEIELNHYLSLSKQAKTFLRGYRRSLDFEHQDVKLDSYLYGFIYGLKNFTDARLFDLEKNIEKIKTDTSVNINSLKDNIDNDIKFLDYKLNSGEVRLELLKGFIDASRVINSSKNEIVFEEKSEKVKEDILFVLNSLLINYKISEEGKKIRISLENNFERELMREEKYRFEVEYVGEEQYYGFTITGNGRYLLDNCTVTHNTCTSIAVAENLKSEKNIIIMLPASLRSNYVKALVDECGDKAYKTNRNKLNNKYHFISYNASNTIDQLKKIPSLDNHVIIVDEIHNLVSMMVSNSKKGPEIYNMLMNAKNCKIVALSGTPVVNFPFEVAKLANILCGFIELNIFYVRSVKNSFNREWNLDFLANKLELLKSVNYVEVQGKNILVNLFAKSYDPNFPDIVNELIQNADKLGVRMDFIETRKFTLFPDNEDEFRNFFVEETPDGELLKNSDLLKRRLMGLISYYRGGKPIYFPKVNPVHLIEVPMSNYQFRLYEEIRTVEREKEKGSSFKKAMKGMTNSKSKNASKKKVSSLFRVFSREFSNFVFPEEIERPFVKRFIKLFTNKKKKSNEISAEELKILEKENTMQEQNKNVVGKDKKLIEKAINELSRKKDEYLKDTDNGLRKYSPKMAKMLEIINTSPGLVFVYSAFRTLEGIEVFKLVLEANGYKQYRVGESNKSEKVKFAIWSGTESEEERQDILKVFTSYDNRYGEKIKILLATSAGAEGIDLKNIRQVHVMEPYWHEVRVDQVIGRANRMKSHVDLPKQDWTVDVYRYHTVFDKEQREVAKEKITTDEFIYDKAMKKLKVTDEIKKTLKEIAVDCTLNAVDNGKDIKCFSFGMDANGLAYKANISEDFVYGRSELGTKQVKRKLKVMFLDENKNVIFANKKKKVFCYLNDTECKNPIKNIKKLEKIAVDEDSLEAFEIESAKLNNPIKIGDIDKDGILR